MQRLAGPLRSSARRIATSATHSGARTRGSAVRLAVAAVGGAALVAVAQPRLAAEAPESPSDKRKPIYDDKEASLPSPPAPSELELLIRKTRHAVTDAWKETRQSIDGAVNSWIATEEAIEAAIKDVAEAREPFMPGAAFVAGSYIAGLIVARKRGFITRLLTPLTFASISMIVIYPRTTRNIVVKAGGQPILDSLSEASGATSSAFESGVHTLFEGLDTVRATLSDLVGKTESAVSDSVKSAAKVIEHVPEQVTEAVHRAEDAVKHALDHPKEKPSAEFEAGADLHTRDASSYTSLEVDAADTPTGGKSPRSAVVEAVEKAEEKLEEFVEEAREALKRSMEHKKEKPTAEFEGGAELHTRGAESYTSLEVDAADTPSGKSPETPILAAVHKAEEVVEHFVEEVKELAKEAKEAVEKTLDHKREKPSVEFEGGAELHTRGPESYSSLEVDAADTPKGKSPPSVIGGAVHKAEQAVEQLVDEVKKALDSQSRSK